MGDERELDPESLGDHVDRLYRAAWGLCGSRQDAEDLVQETFVHVLRRPRFLRSDNDIGYLLRVLRNTFISSRRTSSRRPQEVLAGDDLELLAGSDPAAAERWIDSNELYGAISQLPDAFRDALIAVDLVGLSYREAARALNVPEATITTRLHRARQRIVRSIDLAEREPRS
jgi:RNA polymerase sigma-70 factor, ECF subfamily